MSEFHRPEWRVLPTMPAETVPNRYRTCERCGRTYVAYERRARAQRFCGDSCRNAAWREVQKCGPRKEAQAPEIRRQSRSALKILGRLQLGPATGMQLMYAGGGVRYGARLLELRQAGHNIEAIHKGEGVWEYRLILP